MVGVSLESTRIRRKRDKGRENCRFLSSSFNNSGNVFLFLCSLGSLCGELWSLLIDGMIASGDGKSCVISYMRSILSACSTSFFVLSRSLWKTCARAHERVNGKNIEKFFPIAKELGTVQLRGAACALESLCWLCWKLFIFYKILWGDLAVWNFILLPSLCAPRTSRARWERSAKTMLCEV